MKVIKNNHETELRTKICERCKSVVELTGPDDITDVFGHDTYWSCPMCNKSNSISMSGFPFSWRRKVFGEDDVGH